MKLMKVLVAALVLVGMVVPAIAEDRLSLSGEMRVRGYMYDTDYTDFGDEEDSGAWNDQRLRVMGKLAVAEGVNVVFRFDATESNENSSDAVAWGGAAGAYQYAQRRGDIQFDLAYLSIEKNGFTLLAGQQYFGGYGYTGKMMDVVGAGFTGKYKGFTLSHVKRMDENSGNNSFNGIHDGDTSLSGIKYDFKGEGFTLTPMVAYNADASSTNYEVLGFGLAGSFDLGAVLLKGEFNYFDGSTDSYRFPGDTVNTALDDVDVEGMQAYLDASVAVTNNVRLGLMGFWAEGQDDSIQATNMNRDASIVWTFADYHPESYGYWSTDFVDEFYDIYDPAGANAGVIAVQLYADAKVSENTNLKFAAMYFQNEDDEFIEYDGYTLNAGIGYNLTKNVLLTAHVNYLEISVDKVEDISVNADGDTLQMISGIQVKF